MVLGLGLAGGEEVSLGLLTAIFVSNLPEAIGSASAMRAAGRSSAGVLTVWLAVAAVCALATGAGFAIGDGLSGDLEGAVDGFAAAVTRRDRHERGGARSGSRWRQGSPGSAS